ncbi:MAG: sulfurtransferase TusA family protein [Alphaproteobacteria bacterium]|nr:sulfurtransferase TusA family protein [Alphaproteobacteria bacterium]MCY4319414.1 sulfurtransferase TusA family protein [Alphaproteobacteria bacterium]
MADMLDATGLRCPIPVLRARKRLRAMAPGDRLEVWTDDPASPIDMRHFCAVEGHEIVEAQEGDSPYRFVIARAAPSIPESTD